MHYTLNAYISAYISALMKACLWSTNDEKAAHCIGGPPSCVKDASKVRNRRAKNLELFLFLCFLAIILPILLLLRLLLLRLLLRRLINYSSISVVDTAV